MSPPRDKTMEQAPALRLVDDSDTASGADAASLSLEAAFRRYSPYVAAISSRLLGRDDDVDDVVQDVFLIAIRGIRQLRDQEALKGWLATVTVRVARRRLQMRRMKSFLGLDEIPGYGELMAPTASAEQRVLLARVYRVLDDLPVDQRIAWVLRHVQGEQLGDIATMCGCSLATAKRKIAAAQERIERALGDE